MPNAKWTTAIMHSALARCFGFASAQSGFIQQNIAPNAYSLRSQA